MAETAITPTREVDYPEWYQQVIKASDLAENAPVRGCMVIKPYGFALWENIQSTLDKLIKAGGYSNAYFPLFIPLSFLQKEAQHVEGFAKECAVVTHHRLEEKEGKLVPTGELEEPLIVRPTSEMIIGDCFSRWVESYRHLPLLINQWANVVRWEMRTRLFLRTTEFLWHEGHSAHASEKEALEETLKNLELYTRFNHEVLAIPVIPGEKSAGERFPGAVKTFTIEAMMQDRKALQGGTSHYLGQNFAKAQEIKFSNVAGDLEYAYTTSFGTTTRLIGSLIMTHSDDDGLRLPPRIAPTQVVIIPVIPKPELQEQVFAYAQQMADLLKSCSYDNKPISVSIDKRDLRGGEKNWEWIKKGVPVRIEVGPKDIETSSVMLARRDRPHKEKVKLPYNALTNTLPQLLEEIQRNYYQQALEFRNTHTHSDIQDLEAFKKFFTPKNSDKPEIHGGFVLAKWSEDPQSEELLKELKVTIRCLPLDQDGKVGKCILTGKPAIKEAIFAKSY